MSLMKIGLAVAGIAVLPLVAIGLDWQFDLSSRTSAWPAHNAQVAKSFVPTVGHSRDAKLQEFTQLYISRNDNVSSRITSGVELAPVLFLNQELKREGAKWCVRSVNGTTAKIYDIS